MTSRFQGLRGYIGSLVTKIKEFTNGMVKAVDKQGIYLLAQACSQTGQL